MKTTVNFLEAVKALSEGKCERIESPRGTTYSIDEDTISLDVFNNGHALGVCLPCESFLGAWKLIGKQKVVIEDVEWLEGDCCVAYPIGKCAWQDLLKKPKMKMTLEWVEK